MPAYVQEHIQSQTISIVTRGARMSGKALAKLMQRTLSEMDKRKKAKASGGEKSIRELTQGGQKVDSIDIADIKSFEHVARRYGVEYAITKDGSVDPPKWTVFFKARDVDLITAAFKEYSAMVLSGDSIHDNMREKQEILRNTAQHVVKNAEQGAR